MITHRSILHACLAAALLLSVGACKSKNNESPSAAKHEIVVSAAASLRESMQEIGGAFEKETGTHVVFNFGGSNELARQIVAAPKADLFLSAAENWMDTVDHAGRLVPGTRRDLLSNSLVVIAQSGSTWAIDTPCALAAIPFKHLAMGDPEAVPAGKYARTWLTSIQCGGRSLWDAVSDRVAPAPDVRAALALVVADPGLLGVVYRTDWLAFKDRTRVLYEVKDGPPIRYALAQIAGAGDKDDARKLLDYMAGAQARAVFERHGFTVPASAAAATP